MTNQPFLCSGVRRPPSSGSDTLPPSAATAKTLRTAIEEFLPVADIDFADPLTEETILGWYRWLRKRGNSNRTIYNKHVSVFGFLKWCGYDTKLSAEKAPVFTEKQVDVYKSEDLNTFFSSLTDAYHQVVFETFLKTGFRMQEAMHLEWHDFNFQRGTLAVKAKPDLGFDVKDTRSARSLFPPV